MCFSKVVLVCRTNLSLINYKLYKIKILVDLNTKTKFNDTL